MKSSQNSRYQKSYFQGPNEKDSSIFIKVEDKLKSKNIARKSKLKVKNKKK